MLEHMEGEALMCGQRLDKAPVGTSLDKAPVVLPPLPIRIGMVGGGRTVAGSKGGIGGGTSLKKACEGVKHQHHLQDPLIFIGGTLPRETGKPGGS